MTVKNLGGVVVAAAMLQACGGESLPDDAPGVEQQAQAQSSAACHISLLPKYNAQWKASLDKITTAGSQMAMASTAKSVTFTCAGGATATLTPTVDRIASYPLELLTDDANYDISTPNALGRWTNGCLAQNALAGQVSFGTLQNGSCNTSSVGNHADNYPRYFSTHYGSWPASRNGTQYLQLTLQSPSSGPGAGLAPIFSGITVRSGAADIYGSADGNTYTRVAANVKGTASFNISTKFLRFTAAGAALGIAGGSPIAIDDIEVDFAKPKTTVFGKVPRIVNLSYVAPGNASTVSYSAGSYTGSSASFQTTSMDASGAALSLAVLNWSFNDSYNYTITGSQTHDQFTVETGYEVDSNSESTPHGKDLFAIWLNASLQDTLYFDGRPPALTIAVPDNAEADIETATADQLMGNVAIPGYNTGLLALTQSARTALASADPFVADPNFDPATQPKRFGLYKNMVVDNSGDFGQGSVGGTTLALTWDKSLDQTHGWGSNSSLTVGFGESYSWGDYNGVSGTINYTSTWDYQQSSTHTTGTTSSASAKLSSTNPCRHFSTKVYLDSLFNTYVFATPGPLPNGVPAGFTCNAACPAGTPAVQNNSCECNSDAQCPNSYCSLGTSYQCDTGALQWTFENKSTAGAYLAPYAASSGALKVLYNSVLKSYALAVPFDKSLGTSVSVRIPVAHADLRGKRLSAHVYLAGAALPVDEDNGMTLAYGSTNGDAGVAYQYQASSSYLYYLMGVFGGSEDYGNADPSDVTYVGVNMELTDVPAGFKGTLYIDDIAVSKN